jgi:hypothetical protein
MKQKDATAEIVKYREEIKTGVMANKEVFNELASKTFKGLDAANIPQALLEGMMRGFTIEDFIKKNVYATPFWNSKEGRQEYALVTSIDRNRKVAARSGQSGKSAPLFKDNDDGSIESCTITVWKKGGDERGYTATVYFKEYSTNRNLWTSKPRTMIAKVAEMHALRAAFPEELAQAYVEEEYEHEDIIDVTESKVSDELRKQVSDATTNAQLKKIWESNSGLGKEFANLITEQKKFIKGVKEAEAKSV